MAIMFPLPRAWPILVLSLLALFLAATSRPLIASAQEPTGLKLHIDAVQTEAYPQAKVTVTALDGASRPLLGLTAPAFQAQALLVDGQASGVNLPVTGVAGSADQALPIAAVLAFDTSGSMRGAPLEQAKQAGKDLIAQLGPADQAAVLLFADKVQLVQPFTTDKAALARAIESLTAGGNTALYDAVAASVGLAKASGLPRKAVVLLSDGLDFGGASSLERDASLQAAQSAGVPMFLVGLGSQIDQAYLQELVKRSGGQMLLAPQPQALTSLYQTIGEILRHQYVLTLDISALALGSAPLLRVSVAAGGATASAQTPLRLPVPPALAPPASAVEAEGSPPVQEATGAGVPLFLPVLAAVAGAGLAAGLLLRARWRRRMIPAADPAARFPVQPVAESLREIPAPYSAPRAQAASAWLEVLSLGNAPATPAGGQVYPLESALTIGYTYDCDVRLPQTEEGRPERARLWQREGRFMLHNLSPKGEVSVAGRRVVWAVLEDGDELELGPCRLRFKLASAPLVPEPTRSQA